MLQEDEGDAGSVSLFRVVAKANSKNLLEEIKLRQSLEDLGVKQRHTEKIRFNLLHEQKVRVYKSKIEILSHKMDQQSRGLAEYNQLPYFGGLADSFENRRTGTEKKIQNRHQMPFAYRALKAWKLSNTKGTGGFSNPRNQLTSNFTIKELEACFGKNQRLSTQKAPPFILKRHDDSSGPTASRGKASSISTSHRRRQSVSFSIPNGDNSNSIFGESKPRNTHQISVAQNPNQRLPSMPIDEANQIKRLLKQTLDRKLRDNSLEDPWVGSPEAIGSVRRMRRSPEEVNGKYHHRSVGEIRRILDEMPNYKSCSRNCHWQATLHQSANSVPRFTRKRLAVKIDKPKQDQGRSEIFDELSTNESDWTELQRSRRRSSTQLEDDTFTLQRLLAEEADFREFDKSRHRKKMLHSQNDNTHERLRIDGGYTGRFAKQPSKIAIKE